MIRALFILPKNILYVTRPLIGTMQRYGTTYLNVGQNKPAEALRPLFKGVCALFLHVFWVQRKSIGDSIHSRKKNLLRGMIAL